MKKILISAVILALALVSAQAQTRPAAPVKPSDYQFTIVKENPITSIKNQNRSGTCWCFSALSFLESEVIKGKGLKDPALYPDFSEMYVVRRAYADRARKFVRLDGRLGFSAGSDFGDVFEVARHYGLIDQKAYSGHADPQGGVKIEQALDEVQKFSGFIACVGALELSCHT